MLPPQIPVPNLITFAETLEVGYSKYKNPYHNLIHAADVTQTVHYILIHTGIMVRNTTEFNLLLFADSLMFWIDVYAWLQQKAPMKIIQREIPNFLSGCELHFNNSSSLMWRRKRGKKKILVKPLLLFIGWTWALYIIVREMFAIVGRWEFFTSTLEPGRCDQMRKL